MKESILAREDGLQAPSLNSRYRTLSLIDLIRQIVDTGDLGALHEFHNRPIFRYNDGPPLLLADYVMALRRSLLRRESAYPITLEIADKAYDMTIDKLTNIPIAEIGNEQKGKESDL